MKRCKKGFALVEMLATTLILALLGGAVAMGVSASARVCMDSTFVSESELLASTLDSALSDLLRYADTEGDLSESNGTPLFTNLNYGVTDGYLLIQDGKFYLHPSTLSGSANLAALMSSGTYADMQVKDLTLTYSDGVFSGSYTIADQSGTLTKQVTFEDRAVNAA